MAPFADLRARHGVFFVTGNHDHYSGAESWVEAVRGLGMRVLRNERVEIGAPGASFDLAGVDDHHAHFTGDGREDLARALAGRDPERAAVLLAHDPSTFARARARGDRPPALGAYPRRPDLAVRVVRAPRDPATWPGATATGERSST